MNAQTLVEPFYRRILYGPADAEGIGVCVEDTIETIIALPLIPGDVARIEVTKPEDMVAVATLTLTKPLDAAGSTILCVDYRVREYCGGERESETGRGQKGDRQKAKTYRTT